MIINIRNWDKYNPKRDQKSYTWLRLNNDTFSGQDFCEYSAQELIVWISILCEASKKNSGKIDLKLPYLKIITRLSDTEINAAILKLHDDNYLEIEGDVVSLHHAVAPLQITTPTYVRTYERTNNIVDLTTDYTHPLEIPCDTSREPSFSDKCNTVAEIWNDIGSQLGLAKVRVPLSKDRMEKMRSALSEFTSPQDWVKITQAIEGDDFLMGKNDRKWKASFDWLFHKTKFNYRKLWEAHDNINWDND